MSVEKPCTVRGTVCNRPDFAAKVANAVRQISGAAVGRTQLPQVRERCVARVEIAARHIEQTPQDDIRLAGLFLLLRDRMAWQLAADYDPSPSPEEGRAAMVKQHQVLVWFGTSAAVPHDASTPNRCEPEDLLGELLYAAAEDALQVQRDKFNQLVARVETAERHNADIDALHAEVAQLQGDLMGERDKNVQLTHDKTDLVRERDLFRTIADGSRKRTAKAEVAA